MTELLFTAVQTGLMISQKEFNILPDFLLFLFF